VRPLRQSRPRLERLSVIEADQSENGWLEGLTGYRVVTTKKCASYAPLDAVQNLYFRWSTTSRRANRAIFHDLQTCVSGIVDSSILFDRRWSTGFCGFTDFSWISFPSASPISVCGCSRFRFFWSVPGLLLRRIPILFRRITGRPVFALGFVGVPNLPVSPICLPNLPGFAGVPYLVPYLVVPNLGLPNLGFLVSAFVGVPVLSGCPRFVPVLVLCGCPRFVPVLVGGCPCFGPRFGAAVYSSLGTSR